MSEKVCLECGVGMEVGFVPDHGYNCTRAGTWYRGVTEKLRFLGIEVGSGAIRVPPIGGIPVKAYRCPRCAVLKFYAEKGGAE